MQRRRAMCLFLLLAACKEEPQAAPPPPSRVTAIEARYSEVPLAFDYGGRVNAVRQTEVRARVGGIMLERAYVEGQHVELGEVLFRIDPATYQAAVDLAAAQVQEAEAAVQRARRDHQRAVALLRADAGTLRSRDDAISALAQSEAVLTASRARLARAELDLGYTTVTAPISGVTSLQAVPEGSLIGTSESDSLLTRITQLDPVYVTFAFNAPDLAALAAEGSRDLAVQVLLEGRERPQGRLTFTEGTIDPVTGTVRGRATFDNAERRLTPGQFVRVRVLGPVQQVIRVPQGAVQQDVQGPFVFVIGPGDKAERRAVTLGRLAGEDWIIDAGLRPGDRVVTEGLVTLVEGAAVDATP
nr:efflux RND transporter periplasmic adaptor subunit [uncultured Roseococcus sp.]